MEGCWILETRIRPMSLARSLSGLQLFSNVMLCHVEEKIRLCSADRKQQNEWYEELGKPRGKALRGRQRLLKTTHLIPSYNRGINRSWEG